jgi:hypothetical protein
MREKVYMPPALAKLLSTHEQTAVEYATFCLAEVAHISPEEAREKTYRLWGYMIAMGAENE